MGSRKLAKPKRPAPPKVRVRIQSFSLEVERTNARGDVVMLEISGENLGAATLGELLGGVLGAARGGQ
jgi:hypothetical protein